MARSDSLGIAAQAAWGTPEDTMEYYPPVESVDVSHNTETIEIEETLGNRFPSRIEKGTRYGELSIAMAPRIVSFPRLLSGLLGEPNTTQPAGTGAPTVFEHEFDPAAADADPIPLSLLVDRRDPDPGITDLFWDALVNEMTLSCEPNGLLMANMSVVAARVDEGVTPPSVTADTSTRFPFHTAVVYLTADIDGDQTPTEVEIPVSSWSITYSNNIPTDTFVLGSRYLYEVRPDNATCDVSFTIRGSDLDAHHRRALETFPTGNRLRMVATGPEIDGGYHEQIEVDVALFEYTDAPANINAGERLNSIEVTGRAAYDEDSDRFVTVTVTNSVSSYEQPGT